jgi:ABC-2 type transport system permease protein
MQFDILLFEIRRRMTNPMTYIFFLIFAFLGFLGIWRASLGRGLLSRLTLAGQGLVEADAPYALYHFITLLSTFGLLIAMAWFGNAASRDFRLRAFHLFFSYPVNKFSYLVGRFGGAMTGIMFVLSGIAAGGLIATMTPLVDPTGIGTVNIFAFIHPYLVSVFPNLLLAGALFFSLTLLSRQFNAVWAAMACIVVLHFAAIGLVQADFRLIASLIDPSGLVATRLTYSYWSIAEKNELLIPMTGYLLMNRLLWISVAAVVCVVTYRRFNYTIPVQSKSGRMGTPLEVTPGMNIQRRGIVKALQGTRNFSLGSHLRLILHLMEDDFRHLVQRRSFYFVVALGIGLVLVTGYNNIGIVRGTQTFPVTSQVLDALCDNLYFLGVLMAMYCSSALLWRQRDTNVHEIMDTLPVPRWVPLVGKIGAMTLVQSIMMGLVMMGGIVIQLQKGYYHFELGLYYRELLGVQLIFYVLVSVFALFAQVAIGNKLLGFVVTLFFIDEFMEMFGLKHHLWTFASRPPHIYSDMNGYGPFGAAIAAYNTYWVFFALILVVLTMVLYPKGFDTGLKQRFKSLRSRMSRRVTAVMVAGAIGCAGVGGCIVYNTVILNVFETAGNSRRHMAEYEKTYKYWEQTPQAHVTAITAEVDLFPADRCIDVCGKIRLVNETQSALDTLFIQVPTEVAIRDLQLGSLSETIHADSTHGVYLFKLQKPMQPGAATDLRFEFNFVEQGFKDSGVNTRLVKNGTFLSIFHFLPASGYNPYLVSELTNNDQRERYQLSRAERLPPATDTAGRMYTMLGNHADWIDFEMVVSTAADQIAIAPGDLIREWKKDGRRYFHYQAPEKILRYGGILSGRYTVCRDTLGDVDIEIYHHPEHEYNIDLMVESVKRSLEYFSREFSPYQFSTLRIVEFPRYELFAEAFPGLIPFSEGYGFITKYDDTKLKEAYRVVAHEVGHQWWAHQVIGGNVEGAFVLTEVMAQYSALMVSRGEYDRSQMDAYLRKETDRYLRGRGRETEGEVPLIRTNQQTWYEHYAKGFIVMNTLVEYIGEDQINQAIRTFIDNVAFQEPPFTTSYELVDQFKAVTPDSLLYIVEDCFDRIVFFDNEALAAECERGEDGRYNVTLTFEARKWIADGRGAESVHPLRDLLEFAVFDEHGREIGCERQWIDNESTQISMIVDGVPARAGIDPHHLLIDKKVDNNFVDVVLN